MNTPITRKQVVGNIFLLFSANSFGQLATGLSILFTARPLGVGAFGQYSACFALTRISSIIFTLGMDTWMLREGRRGQHPLGKLVANNLLLKLLLGLIWSLGLLIVSRFLNPLSYPPRLLFLSALATWLEAALQTVSYAFIISLKNQKTAVLELTSSFGLLAGTLMLVFQKQADPLPYVWVRLLVAGVVALAGLWWFSRENILAPEKAVSQATLRNVPPFALSDVMLLIYTQADITIVAMLLGQNAAGVYSPASGLLRALFVIPTAVNLVMTPLISQLASASSSRLASMVRRTYLSLIGIGALMWLGTSLLGPGLCLLLLGPKFAQSGGLLSILSAILFLKSCSLAAAAVIVATSGQGYRVIVQAVAAAANVLLNLLVIHRYGVAGVAWVYVASEAILLIGYLVIADRGLKKALQLSPEIASQ